MKKLDLQGGGIKTKLILHVEKLVFGLAILLVALFIYKGTQQDAIDTTPESVKQAADLARQNIEKQTWDEVEGERWERPEYQTAATRASQPIPLASYEMPNSMRVRHRESIEKRSDPELLPLYALEVKPGFAPFVMLDRARDLASSGGYGGEYGGEGPGYDGGGYGGAGYGGYDEYAEYGYGGSGAVDPNAPPKLTPEQKRKLGAPKGTSGTGSKVEGKYFIAVTALAPLKKQLDLYDAAFKDRASYDEGRDYPRYVHFMIERRHQSPDGSWSDWNTINPNAARTIARTTWGFTPEDVAPPEYKDQTLTFPLPPIVLFNPGDWGLHSSVPKFVPRNMYGQSGSGMPMQEEVVAEEPATPLQVASDLPADIPGAMGPRGGGYGGSGYEDPYGGGYGSGYGSGPGGGYGMTNRRPTPPPGMILRRSSRSGGSYTGGPSGYEGSGGYGGGTSMFDAENKMFRFYDTSVEPSKTYQYRVQLWLEDPNNPQNLQQAPPARALESTVLQRVEANRRSLREQASNARAQQRPQHTYWRTTEFSEPSPAVSVPVNSDVLTGSVDGGRKIVSRDNRRQVLKSAEPSTTVLAMKWDPNEKSMATKAVEGINRGATVQYEGELWVMDPATQTFEKLGEDEKYSLRTGYTVLDIRGGDDLPGRMTNDKNERLKAPGEILVMDPTGQLHIKSEIDEIEKFSLYNFAKEEVKRRPAEEEMDPYAGYEDPYGGGRRGRRGR